MDYDDGERERWRNNGSEWDAIEWFLIGEGNSETAARFSAFKGVSTHFSNWMATFYENGKS